MGSEGADGEAEQDEQRAGPGPGTIAAARQRIRDEGDQPRTRSPTPPRALYRSTTGKGVAFTEDDVTFLMRFMQYKKFVQRIFFLLLFNLHSYTPQIPRQN